MIISVAGKSTKAKSTNFFRGKFNINPVPKARMPGRTKFGNPAAVRTLEFQRQIANMTRFMGIPKYGSKLIGFSKLIFRRCGRKCDLDNLLKSTLDGMEYGGAFKNDNQIRAIDGLRVEYVKEEIEAGIEFEIYQLDV